MENLLKNIDWVTIMYTIWTAILIPVARQVYEHLKLKRLDKYTAILYEEVTKAVKSVYETEVKDIKHTVAWTQERQKEVLEIAKTKTIQALSSSAQRCLKEANSDFGAYLESLIGTALYDLKN